MTGSNIVILTGAGISQESGLATFRDPDGIWSTVRIEEVATPEAFAADAERVHGFYNARRQALCEMDISPNPAHEALVHLEQHWPGEVLIVTQNIDDLHERAGSKNLIHMHGELLKVRCTACAEVVFWTKPLTVLTACPACNQAGRLRPDVVWFGEMPLFMDRIYQALEDCHLFISIGTSGNVYPAAGFVEVLRRRQEPFSIELNMEPSQGASLFDAARYGPASQLVPAYIEEILGSQ